MARDKRNGDPAKKRNDGEPVRQCADHRRLGNRLYPAHPESLRQEQHHARRAFNPPERTAELLLHCSQPHKRYQRQIPHQHHHHHPDAAGCLLKQRDVWPQ